jgi:hypothetical protein
MQYIYATLQIYVFQSWDSVVSKSVLTTDHMTGDQDFSLQHIWNMNFNYSVSLNAKVKNVWSFTSTPTICLRGIVFMHKDNYANLFLQ